MADNNNTVQRDKDISWLFPELLTNTGIIEFLKQRQVDVPEDSIEDRHHLLELYYNHAIPLPQRKYRLNRRGREMTKKQILLAKKRKITFSDEFQPSAKKSTVSTETLADNPLPRFMTSASLSTSSTESVQPPKSMINFNRKVIKLNSGKANSDNTESNSTSSSISSSLTSVNSETKSQTIKLKSSKPTSLCIDQADPAKPKKLNLKRTEEKDDSPNVKRELSPVEAQVKKDSEDGGSPKKKIKRISWP